MTKLKSSKLRELNNQGKRPIRKSAEAGATRVQATIFPTEKKTQRKRNAHFAIKSQYEDKGNAHRTPGLEGGTTKLSNFFGSLERPACAGRRST